MKTKPIHDDYDIFDNILNNLTDQRQYKKTDQLPDHWKHKAKIEAKAKGERVDFTDKIASKGTYTTYISKSRTVINIINADRQRRGLQHVKNYKELRLAFEALCAQELAKSEDDPSKIPSTTLKGYYNALAKAMGKNRETWQVKFGKISYKNYTKNTKELTKANTNAIKNHPDAWIISKAIGSRETGMCNIRFCDIDLAASKVWISDAKGGKQYFAPISAKYKDQFEAIVIKRVENRNINGRLLTKTERRAALPWQHGRQIYSADQYFEVAKSQAELKKMNAVWYNKRHDMTSDQRKKDTSQAPAYAQKLGNGKTRLIDREALYLASIRTGHNRDEIVVESYAQHQLVCNLFLITAKSTQFFRELFYHITAILPK